MQRPDLNLFFVFDSIYKQRSVTKVAKQLNITQPAVSNSLSRLRQMFNDQLFVRTPNGMAPTPVAEGVIQDVRKALALLEKTVGVGARFNPATSDKTLKIGTWDLPAMLLLPGLAESIATEAPNVTLQCFYNDRDEAVEELKSGTIDFLIDAPAFNAKEFDMIQLGQFNYVVAYSDQFAVNHDVLTLESYLAAQHIHVSGRKKGAGQADIALHSMGDKRKIAMRVQHYLLAQQLASTNGYLLTVPEIAINSSSNAFTLKKSKPPFVIDPLILNLYWRKTATDDPAIMWFKDRIFAVFAAQVGDTLKSKT